MIARDMANATLGGVCAGLGKHLDIDPFWFRLAFVVGVVCYGVGLLPYLILWLLMPKE